MESTSRSFWRNLFWGNLRVWGMGSGFLFFLGGSTPDFCAPFKTKQKSELSAKTITRHQQDADTPPSRHQVSCVCFVFFLFPRGVGVGWFVLGFLKPHFSPSHAEASSWGYGSKLNHQDPDCWFSSMQAMLGLAYFSTHGHGKAFGLPVFRSAKK